ncbi:hypothetical protein [Spiroplasma endosymbiont of Polydrusus cervinus]|uniref:Y-family DNA polymerase n=1 Tax=Spiroplasma endosymbiont of Polydrusus cervinus TaxID=3066287 RepID=UPI0030CD7BD8
MIELLLIVILVVFSLHIYLVIILFLKRFINTPDHLGCNRVGELEWKLFFILIWIVFFASCHQVANPQLQGKPLVVANSSRRAIVTTAN